MSFVLGLGFGIVVPALVRRAREGAKAPTLPTVSTEVQEPTEPAKSARARAAAAPPATEAPPKLDSEPRLRLHSDDTSDGIESTAFTMLLKQDALPSLRGDEDGVEETPSVSLVSYIDELDTNRDGKAEPLRVQAIGKTDIGLRRKTNEDRYVILHDEESKRRLFAVIDGLGGQGSGGLASRLAAEIIACRWAAPGLHGSISAQRPTHANNLVWALEQANKVIYETSQESQHFDGMGAAVVAAVLDEATRCMYIAHIGDSRAYRLRKGQCELLTVDHRVAHEGPMAAYLRRALGVRPNVKVDVTVGTVQTGDTYLFCSDGLSSMKSNKEIAALLAASNDPDQTTNRLIDEANKAGGKDNIAVVVVKLDDARRQGKAPDSRPYVNRPSSTG
jgi:protein phosphatase